MIVLSVLNKKGGVGKTTIATNLAQGLAILGQRVLVVDNDEQHNLTTSVGLNLRNCPRRLSDVLVAAPRDLPVVVNESIYTTFIEGLDCIPGSKALEDIKPRDTALKEALNTDVIKALNYDCVIIDNAPTISKNTRCAIKCSTHFLLPVQLRKFSIDGLVEMLAVLKDDYQIPEDSIMIVRNMYKNIKTRTDTSERLAGRYGEMVLNTVIPEDEIFEKVLSEKYVKSMYLSRSKCKGTLLFQELICEMFNLNRKEMMSIFEKKVLEYRSDIASENLKKARITNISLNKKGAVK